MRGGASEQGRAPIRGLLRSAALTLGLAGIAIAALQTGCGGPAAPVLVPVPPPAARTLPSDREARREALRELGAWLHGALCAGRPQDLLFGEGALRALLSERLASREILLRGAERPPTPAVDLWQGVEFSGICLQGARDEPPQGRAGLRAEAWIFERALVVADRSDGRRVAAWIEGLFVYTDQGFGALSLRRVEDPRWEHSDLEIAPCDMQIGIADPQDIAVVTP
ncbi:MAG: hypothetical protein OEY14_18020 [Myxococcales bacterium]|nr:hypothetical protein [Myxococcales bacterium]